MENEFEYLVVRGGDGGHFDEKLHKPLLKNRTLPNKNYDHIIGLLTYYNCLGPALQTSYFYWQNNITLLSFTEGNRLEFLAYRILYYIYIQNNSDALKVRSHSIFRNLKTK